MKKGILLIILVIIAVFIYNGVFAYELIASNSPSFKPRKEFLPGRDLIYLQLSAQDKDKENIGQIQVKLLSALGLDREEFVLSETGKNTGIFCTKEGIKILPQKKIPGDGILQVAASADIIYVLYSESFDKEGVAATLTALAAVDKFSVLVDNLIQTAGRPFSVEIIARDRQNNILTNYAGTVTLEAQGQPLLTTSSFSNGAAHIFIAYPEAGKVKIKVKDLHQRQGESKEICFLPAKFKVEAPAPLPYVVGKEFALKATALNYRDEFTRNYEGSAVVKPLGQDSSFQGNVLFSQGVAEINITYNQWGERKFIVCDKIYRDICGVTEDLFFAPYRFNVEIDSPPPSRKQFYFEELFKGKISVFDYLGNLVPEYAGAVIFEPVKDIDLPQRYYFDWRNRGKAEFYLSGITDKPFKVKIYDEFFPEAKGESGSVKLMFAQIKTELLEVRGAEAKLKIKIEDGQGNVVKQDNATVFTVHLVEDNPDASASLIGSKKLRARKGEVVIAVADDQKEVLTVFIEPEPYLEAESCRINFD